AAHRHLQRVVPGVVLLADRQRRVRGRELADAVHLERPARRELVGAAADEVADAERRGRDGRREPEGELVTPAMPPAEPPPLPRLRRLGQPRRELGRRAGCDQQLVRPAELGQLLRRPLVADQLVEVGRRGHPSSSPRSSARRRRPERVRVFTVPSGILRRSEISLCESPCQYASSRTSRSVSGSVSSARCTRQASQDCSACSGGPGASEAVSTGSAGVSIRARPRSAIALRATAYSQGATGPRSRRYVRAARQTEAKASWAASSARPRSPSRRIARPRTARAYRVYRSPNASRSPSATRASRSSSVGSIAAISRIVAGPAFSGKHVPMVRTPSIRPCYGRQVVAVLAQNRGQD